MSRSQNGNGRPPEPLILKKLSPRGLYIHPKGRELCEPLELRRRRRVSLASHSLKLGQLGNSPGTTGLGEATACS